jgi:hypothetical protein
MAGPEGADFHRVALPVVDQAGALARMLAPPAETVPPKD